MAAKVIRSIRKLSSRKLDVGGSFGFPGTPTEIPRIPLPKIAEKGEKDTRSLKKSAKGKEREPKSKKNKKEKIKEKQPRRLRRSKPETEEDQVGRENDDDSQNQGLMEQIEYIESSTNDYVGGYDFGNPSQEADDTPTGGFACLTPEELIQIRKKHIQEIAELLVISPSNASNLLYHYQWNKEVLHQRYWDSPEECLKEAGLVCASPDADDEAKLMGSGECLVCGETVEGDECCALKCHHRFCVDCWSSYLTVKIKEGEVARINCAALNCKYTVPDPFVQKLVEKETYEKYIRFVTKSFVEDNAQITWCPSPRCGNAITTDMVHEKIVQCQCGFRFCFSCHHEAHAPATCEQVKLWLKKCSDDSETGHWVGANTKDCPRCGVFVEKNGGCNHMTCRQCHYEWCWLCIKQWKGHSDFYACGRYEKAQKKKEKKKSKKQSKQEKEEHAREEKRKALERYLSYYTKYLEYDSKTKNGQNFLDRSKNRIQTLQLEQSTLAEVKFIEIATDTLLECFSILKFSYVGSYYILEENSSEKQIFIFLQEEFEKTVAELAEILDSAVILQRRTECVDVTKLTQTRRDNFLLAVENWMTEGCTGVV